ncbi:MAG: cytochrome c biogenesis protein CcdA [Mucinivorans sp.]
MTRKLLLPLIAILSLVFPYASAQPKNPVEWSAKTTGDEVLITATTERPWHMYDLGPYTDGPNATTFHFELPKGVTLSGTIIEKDKPQRKMDEVFGMQIGVYGPIARFVQKFNNTTGKDAKIIVTVEWQVCDEQSCQAPTDHTFSFTIAPSPKATTATPVATTDSSPVQIDSSSTAQEVETVEAVEPIAAQLAAVPIVESADTTSALSLWAIIIEAILWGFAALLTPCVFPMVPMTVSFFLKGSANKARGRMNAMIYGLSIVALYTIPIAIIIGITYFGGGEAITADIFNWLATHWVPNILFFLIFMTFAASFFGAFEITMPSSLVNRTDSKADKGGLVGVFFMAMTLVLVSFSCTGPIVGTILVKSTQGAIWEPIITMLAFSTAFALPFTIFALFPSLLKSMPKSGGWLSSVKVVLGFIELALGLKFLSVADQTYHWGILDREVYLSLWIVIFSMLGLYFLGKIRFAHDSKTDHVGVSRLFLSILTFSFVVYMIPGMWGAPLKSLSGYLPPVSTIDFDLTVAQAGSVDKATQSVLPPRKYTNMLHISHGLEGFFDMAEGLAYAKSVNKPVFLDFTGHGCVNCREMEANVWSAPEVLEILRNDYVIIALYVDDKKTLPESDWVTDKNGKVMKTLGKINATYQIQRFETNAQPYYCLIDPFTDTLVVQPKAYDQSIPNFVAFLRSGLKAYKEKSAAR